MANTKIAFVVNVLIVMQMVVIAAGYRSSAFSWFRAAKPKRYSSFSVQSHSSQQQEDQQQQQRRRRPRYSGKYPRNFHEKYKEHQGDANVISKVSKRV
jgi:hypothetical protein